MIKELINKWRVRRLKKRYEKLQYEAWMRYLKQKDEALAYRLEEADRKTEATLNNYNCIFKEK